MRTHSNAQRAARLALLGAALVASGLHIAPAGASGETGADPFVQIYDVLTDGASSSIAGTSQRILGCDLIPPPPPSAQSTNASRVPGLPEIVNFVPRGLQVFRNDGGGSFTLVQEIPLFNSQGGSCVDFDRDGDADLVVGSVADVTFLENVGGGLLADPASLFRHGFNRPTQTKVIDSHADASDPDNVRRILLATSADDTDGALPGFPGTDGKPYLYVLERTGGRWTPTQQLSALNIDNIECADLDGDGDNDLVVANRSSTGPPALRVYQSHDADPVPSAGYTELTGLDFTGVVFDFGHAVAVGSTGDLGFGTWHRASILERDAAVTAPFASAAAAWPTVLHVPVDASGALPTGEVWGFDLVDWNGDGLDDAVLLGKDTGLVVVDLSTREPGNPACRFEGANPPGVTLTMAVLDWDLDSNAAPDAVTGGSRGLFWHRNATSGDPPSTEPWDFIRTAYDCLVLLLDPTAAVPFRSPTRRALLGEALADLIRIDPLYLTRGSLLLSPSIVGQINQILNNVRAALAKIANVRAGLPVADVPRFGATLEKIESHLGLASLDLIDDVLAILGTPSAKGANRSLRRAQRQHERARRMRDRVARLLVSAETADSVRESGRLRLRGVRLSRKTYHRAVRAAELYERAGVLVR